MSGELVRAEPGPPIEPSLVISPDSVQGEYEGIPQDLLTRLANAVWFAMLNEGIGPAKVRRRVVSRVLNGHPHGYGD